MKKGVFLFLFLLFPVLSFAAGLDGEIYELVLDGNKYKLTFDSESVAMSNKDYKEEDEPDFEAVFNYFYAEPIGSIEGTLPFWVWHGYMAFATSTLTAKRITPDPEPPPPPDPDPIDLSKVEWLHTDVSSWEVTAELKAIKIKETTIEVDYDKACVWPGLVISNDVEVNANPWIFVELDGKWYAATWEWLKTCQTVKNLYAVDGSHIKVPPLDTWHPVTGETYYFMVSGLARQNQRNVKERSNLLKVVWP